MIATPRTPPVASARATTSSTPSQLTAADWPVMPRLLHDRGHGYVGCPPVPLIAPEATPTASPGEARRTSPPRAFASRAATYSTRSGILQSREGSDAWLPRPLPESGAGYLPGGGDGG